MVLNTITQLTASVQQQTWLTSSSTYTVRQSQICHMNPTMAGSISRAVRGAFSFLPSLIVSEGAQA